MTIRGKFYDGQRAISHDVTVSPTGSALRITSDDGAIEKTWSTHTLHVIEHPPKPQPAKIGSTTMPDALLVIEQDGSWEAIRNRLPDNLKKPFKIPASGPMLIALTGFAIAFGIFIFTAVPAVFEQTYRLVPVSTEKLLGQYALNSMIDGKTCEAEQGKVALNKIIARLESAKEREIDYVITVIHKKHTVNAFAAPGGHLAIYSPAIEKAESPEELAGVLAHEIAHVELYHPTKSLLRDLGLGFLLATITGSSDLSNIATTFSGLSYSRKDEAEADLHGQKIMERSDIDPLKMRLFFERLLETQIDLKSVEEKPSYEIDDKWLEYISTHPGTEKRIAKIKQYQATNTSYRPILSASEWNSLKNICDVKK